VLYGGGGGGGGGAGGGHSLTWHLKPGLITCGGEKQEMDAGNLGQQAE